MCYEIYRVRLVRFRDSEGLLAASVTQASILLEDFRYIFNAREALPIFSCIVA